MLVRRVSCPRVGRDCCTAINVYKTLRSQTIFLQSSALFRCSIVTTMCRAAQPARVLANSSSVRTVPLSVLAIAALLLCAHPFIFSQDAPPAFLITGLGTSGNTAIPGATVTATKVATGEKFVAWTGIDGRYAIQVKAQGKYTLRAEMIAFQALTRAVDVTAATTTAELILTLQSRVTVPGPPQARNPLARAGNRGFQNMSVMQGEAPADAATGANPIVPLGMPVPG